METQAFTAMLAALSFGAPQEAAFALAVAKMRLPAALPQLQEFCPSTIEHIFSGCGLAENAAMVQHRLGLSDEENGLCELWKLANDDAEHGSSDGIVETGEHGHCPAEVMEDGTGAFAFQDLLELTAAPDKLGVKLRADILAIGCWWCVASLL